MAEKQNFILFFFQEEICNGAKVIRNSGIGNSAEVIGNKWICNGVELTGNSSAIV